MKPNRLSPISLFVFLLITACTLAQTTTQPQLLLHMFISDEVRNALPQYQAQETMGIPSETFDADNNGSYDGDTLFEYRLDQIIPAGYKGPVAINWEGPVLEGLRAPPGSAQHTTSLNQFVLVLQRAKQLRPNAEWGYYGLPIGRYHGRDATWYAEAAACQPIFDESQALFPSAYDVLKDGIPYQFPEVDLEVTRDCVKIALMHAAGKPVYPYVAHRWASADPDWGGHLIPDQEFKNNVAAVFDAQFHDDKSDGVILWGADYSNRAHSLEKYPPGHPLYELSQQLQQMFAQEIPPGLSDEEHFNILHQRYLKLCKEAIDESLSGN